MRLQEALRITAQSTGKEQKPIHLLCGFTPLHLATFAKARLSLRFPRSSISLRTGLYGDLEGNIQRAIESKAEGAIVVMEWGDFDPRLGWRNSGGWQQQKLSDILPQMLERCQRLQGHLTALAQQMPLALVGPTLRLPPLSYLPPAQTSPFELRLRAILVDFLSRLSQKKNIKLVNADTLAMQSEPSLRHDLEMDLHSGFPYSLPHADVVARLSVNCLFAADPKKGLITDLDQTLWKGVLGDAGVEGVSWSLESKSHGHALYQQLLASLAESGVLVAIASKNDPDLAEAALQRPDMLIRPQQIFPVETGWGAKSDSIARILKAWNIAADSVVFVDDSPMELAEVAEKHPGIECVRYPSNDPAELGSVLLQLREYFGKPNIGEEDRLRLNSLRTAAQIGTETPKEASADFLARLGAKVLFENATTDQPRAFELVNKTNQFNLNGVRFTEGAWKLHASRPGSFLMTVSYEDRFGPLGRIGVLAGHINSDCCYIDVWVMSCRAFSRHIEFQTLRQVFRKCGASVLRFDFRPTERNGPLQTFLKQFFSPESLVEGKIDLPFDRFEQSCPPLFHEVIESWK